MQLGPRPLPDEKATNETRSGKHPRSLIQAVLHLARGHAVQNAKPELQRDLLAEYELRRHLRLRAEPADTAKDLRCSSTACALLTAAAMAAAAAVERRCHQGRHRQR
jgi:hypothetical protein